jgi:hypothetical protein
MSTGIRPLDCRRVAGVLFKASLAALVASSLIVGFRAFRDDLIVAFRYAGASVFPPSLARQLPTVIERIPEGRPILLLATSADTWNARLWQRALYPRNPVFVRFEPFPDAREMARMADLRDVLFLGRPPPGLAVDWIDDLGSDADGDDRVMRGRPRE